MCRKRQTYDDVESDEKMMSKATKVIFRLFRRRRLRRRLFFMNFEVVVFTSISTPSFFRRYRICFFVAFDFVDFSVAFYVDEKRKNVESDEKDDLEATFPRYEVGTAAYGKCYSRVRHWSHTPAEFHLRPYTRALFTASCCRAACC